MQLSCHCKNVIIEAEKPNRVTECNCSVCSRYGALWGYYAPDDVRIQIGPLASQSYCWGDCEIDFVRCANCGCITHYQTKPGQHQPRIAVNFGLARAAVADVPVRYFNGAEEL